MLVRETDPQADRLGFRLCAQVTVELLVLHCWMAGGFGCMLLCFCIFNTPLLTSHQWQALIATVAYTSADVLLSMVTIYHPSCQQKNWQQSLVMIAVGIMSTLINTYGAKRLPMVETIILVVQIVGFFCISIPLWVLSPKAPAGDVFGSFSNYGGWSSIGTACSVGLITATASFAGSDAAAHMAEGTEDASNSVPWMIMLTIAVNGLTEFIFIIKYVSSQAMNVDGVTGPD